jgi:hypothetical protein
MRSSVGILTMLGLLAPVAVGQLPVTIPMNQQIDIGMGPAITDFTSFEPPGSPEFCRHVLPGGWYGGPNVDFELAGYGWLDLSGGGTTLEFTCRYYKQSGYADAPIFVRFIDANGLWGGLGILYQTGQGDPPYPTWTTKTVSISCALLPGETDPGFDLTQIKSISFYGTDWGGSGSDFIDVKNLKLFVPPNAPNADAGPDQLGLVNTSYDGLPITLDGSGSTPPAGLTYTWKLDGNTLATGKIATVYMMGGTYDITLYVTNEDGACDLDQVTVEITDQLPPIQDNVWGPFGIMNGDIYGRSSTLEIPVLVGPNKPLTVLDQRVGLPDPVPPRQFVFDVYGNVYFMSWDKFLWSLNPDLSTRWRGWWINPGSGQKEDKRMGTRCLENQALVVGERYVYVCGSGDDANGNPSVYAFKKFTGELAWELALTTERWIAEPGEEWWYECHRARPKLTLYDDKLYLVGAPDMPNLNLGEVYIYQIDATNGTLDWYNAAYVGGIFANDPQDARPGTVAFVPNLYDGGTRHGLFFQGRSDGEADGIDDAVGLKINPAVNGGATRVWGNDAGFADRSRAIYSPERNRVYMPNQWNWAGKSYWAFDPLNGLITGIRGGDYAVMDYDAAALSFDGTTVHTGGRAGWLYSYVDNGDGTFTADLRHYNDPEIFGPRAILLRNAQNEDILVTGSQQDWWLPEEDKAPSRVLVLNLSTAPPVHPTEADLDDGPTYVDDVEILVAHSPDGPWTTIYTYTFDNLNLGPIDGQDGWIGYDTQYDPDNIVPPTVVDNLPGGRPGKAVIQDPFGTSGTTWFEGWPFPTTVDPWDPSNPAYGYEYITVRWWQYRVHLTDNLRFYCTYSFGPAFAWDIDLKYHPLDCCGDPTASQTADLWQKVDRIFYFDPGGVNCWVRIRVDGTEDDPNVPPAVLDLPAPIDYLDFTIDATPPSHYEVPTHEPLAAWVANTYNPGTGEWDWGSVDGLSVAPDGTIYVMQFYHYERRYTRLGVGCAGLLTGDANCDGAVNAFDIDPFVIGLTNLPTWQATYGCDPMCVLDCNHDGSINAFDIDPFVLCLTVGCN